MKDITLLAGAKRAEIIVARPEEKMCEDSFMQHSKYNTSEVAHGRSGYYSRLLFFVKSHHNKL